MRMEKMCRDEEKKNIFLVLKCFVFEDDVLALIKVFEKDIHLLTSVHFSFDYLLYFKSKR